jgi:hypothetical protein
MRDVDTTFATGIQMRPSMAADLNNSTFSMKPRISSANDIDQRRAAAKRTALIIGAIAVFLFALSIIEVAVQK